MEWRLKGVLHCVSTNPEIGMHVQKRMINARLTPAGGKGIMLRASSE